MTFAPNASRILSSDEKCVCSVLDMWLWPEEVPEIKGADRVTARCKQSSNQYFTIEVSSP